MSVGQDPPGNNRIFLFIPFLHPLRCTMRIGKGIHPDGVPGWCQGFSLDGGSGVRAVKVIQPGNRPGLIYNIGKWFRSTRKQPKAENTSAFYPPSVQRRNQCCQRERSLQRHPHRHLCPSLPAGQQIHSQISVCSEGVCEREGEETLIFPGGSCSFNKAAAASLACPLFFLFGLLVMSEANINSDTHTHTRVSGHSQSRGLHLHPARLQRGLPLAPQRLRPAAVCPTHGHSQLYLVWRLRSQHPQVFSRQHEVGKAFPSAQSPVEAGQGSQRWLHSAFCSFVFNQGHFRELFLPADRDHPERSYLPDLLHRR